MSVEFRKFESLRKNGKIHRSGDRDFCFLCPFFYKGSFLSSYDSTGTGAGKKTPFWGLTLRSAGDMKFPPENMEQNENRENLYSVLGLGNNGKRNPVRLKLIHSKKIFLFSGGGEKTVPENAGEGDGIICSPDSGVPVITCADCMPIYVYDTESSFRAVFHSGWKGTGIIREGIELFKKKTLPGKLSVVIGPHIHDCCYTVDAERTEYFRANFTPDSVKEINGVYHLSLLKANLFLLLKAGIPEENILVLDECTACNPLFGSFRREGAASFTRMAAFVI